MFIVFGFDNLEIYSTLIEVSTEENYTTEPEITTTLTEPIKPTLQTSTSNELVSTTTDYFPINKQIYFCDFDRFEKENQCNGTLLNNDDIESFSVLKYAYIQSSDTYITDITSISMNLFLSRNINDLI